VVVDAQYKKLNAIRADNADGVYFRNMSAQRAQFNAVYIMETDGFVIDTVVGRWNDEYGFLTFADDHGLYTDCEAYGNGDSGVYPGAAANINATRGHQVDRYAIEIRRCYSHHNLLGYSGTAGNSVWAHDNDFHDNTAGVSMDSAFPDHRACRRTTRSSSATGSTNNVDYYDFIGTAPAQAVRRAWLRDRRSARPPGCRRASASSPRAAPQPVPAELDLRQRLRRVHAVLGAVDRAR
jgi:hypothetical protein